MSTMANKNKENSIDKIILPVLSILNLAGCNPRTHNFISILLWYLVLLFNTIWCTVSVINLCYSESIEDYADNVVNLVIFSQAYIAIFLFRLCKSDYLELLNIISNNFWIDENSPKLKKYHDLLYKAANCYNISVFIATLLFLVEPILKLSRTFPFEIKIADDSFYKSPWFEFIYIFESITITLYECCVVVQMDVLNIVFLGLALIQINMIKNNLKSLDEISSESAMLENLKKCIKQHNIILEVLTKTENIYKYPVLHKLGSCMLILVGFTWIAQKYTLNLKYIAIISATLFQSLIYCFFGDVITQACSSIGSAAYDAPWEKFGYKSVSNALAMMIMRSQREIKMTAGNIVTLSMPTYVAFLRAYYSYYIILINMDMEE